MQELKFKIFDSPGKENTKETLELAKINADLLNIKKIVIASTGGYTINQAISIFDPSIYKLIVVTHNYGFREGLEQEFPEKLRDELEKQGIKVITGVLAFSGVGSALLRKYQQYDTTAMFSRLIRTIMCQGIKVVMEIVLMACDAGAVDVGEDVISIAGTGRGADTCCLINSTSTRLFEKLHVKAILAKPI